MHVSSKPSLLAPDILVLDKFSDYTLFVILTKFQICRNRGAVEFQVLNLATDQRIIENQFEFASIMWESFIDHLMIIARVYCFGQLLLCRLPTF